MSKIEKLGFKDKLPIIKELIYNNEPDIKPNIVTVYTISKCFNVSIIESYILLNQYILEEKDISNYVIFFLCEMVDDTGNCFSKKIICSNDPNINKILEDSNHTLSYSIFAICTMNEYYLIENYKPFIGENIIIERFDFSDIPKDNFVDLNLPKKVETKKEKIEKKIKNDNIIMEKEEENYYIPNKKAKTSKDKINLGNANAGNKRKKVFHEDYKKIEKNADDEKKVESVHSEINLGVKNEEKKDEDVEMKEENVESEPKKVKKIRKVKQTKQYLNEQGYMVTKDVEVEEEYWSDEKPEKKAVKINFIQENKQNKRKKVNKGQTTISSFFKK